MITVHHLNNSRSQRVLWLLEELGLPYEVKRYDRDPATLRAPAALRAVHPLGKSPVISDGTATVAESGAIAEYLIEQHGGGALRPAAGTKERLRYTYWLHYAEGSLMPPLLMGLIAGRITASPLPWFARPIARRIAAGLRDGYVGPQVALHLDYIEQELTAQAWFAGADFSAADVQMSFPLQAAAARAGLDARRPRITAWLERIQARPAWQRALATGGPYALLR